MAIRLIEKGVFGARLGNSLVLFSTANGYSFYSENDHTYMSFPLEDIPLALVDRNVFADLRSIPQFRWEGVTRPFLETRLEVGL